VTPSIEDLRSLPRDAAVVTDVAFEACAIRRAWPGRVVYVGYEPVPESIVRVATLDELERGWSWITRRNPAAMVISPADNLRALVNRMVSQVATNNDLGQRRGRRWVTNMLANLHLLTERACLGRAAQRPLEGVPAIIMGAGPSLDATDLRSKGLVIAVNAATRAAPHDLSFTIESNDITAKFAPGEEAIVAIQTHPANVPHGRVWPILTGEIARCVETLTGRCRVSGSGSGSTAALVLAERMGCDPLILVGQDLALTGGRMYSEHTGFGDVTATRDGAVMRYDWASCARMPRPETPLPETDELVTARGVDGGEVQTIPLFAAVARWLATVPARTKARCLNATAAGLHIDGWARVSAADLPDVAKARIPHTRAPVSEAELRRWRGAVAASVERAALAARLLRIECHTLNHDAIDAATARLLAAARTAPLLDPWVQAQVAQIMGPRREQPPGHARAEAKLAIRTTMRLAETIERAAEELTSAIRG